MVKLYCEQIETEFLHESKENFIRLDTSTNGNCRTDSKPSGKQPAQLRTHRDCRSDRAVYLPDLINLMGQGKPLPTSPFEPIPTISLFTGAGGIDLGFEVAGFSTQCCVEIDEYSCLTLDLNKSFGLRTGLHSFLREAFIICDDIRKVTPARILNLANVKKGKLGLLHGGPPCQAYSVFGKRKGLEDERGTLLWDFVQTVNDLEPECFVLENVEGLKSYNQSSVLNELCERLSFGGRYTISLHTYELADFGVPQFRKRIFIIGSLSGKSVPPMQTTHGLPDLINTFQKPYRTVGEVLEGLGEPGETILPNHVGRVHGLDIQNRYNSLAFGERDPKTRINRLAPNRPSYTIIVGSNKGGGKGHVHPSQPREVTPRESARMQTFPDFWGFSGTSRHPIRQVGNAVPPLFAALIAAHIRKYIFDDPISLTYEDATHYLGLDYLSR
ncbi:DNA cytosine methyltransferase [Leptolyngbyaceae cyanobacterium UHCC 1019]